MQPTSIVAGAIAVFENAIRDVDSLVDELIESSGWATAQVVVVGDPDISDYEQTHVDESRRAETSHVSPEVEDLLDSVLTPALNWYKNSFHCGYVEGPEGYAIVKYSKGGYYNLHADFTPENKRVVSAIFYLNGDYEGGELEFPFMGETVKPKAGMLVLFPSNYAYTHVAKPVLSGTKYAIVTWCK